MNVLNFPCKQAHRNNALIGAIIAKLEKHRSGMRGYIAMLAVQAEYRGQGIGTLSSACFTNLLATELVERALTAMMQKGADEVTTLYSRLTRFRYV